MASKYLQKFPIPQGFQEVLADLTKEVLRQQPENIIQFAAIYFENLEKAKKNDYSSGARKNQGISGKNAEQMTKRASNIVSKIGQVLVQVMKGTAIMIYTTLRQAINELQAQLLINWLVYEIWDIDLNISFLFDIIQIGMRGQANNRRGRGRGSRDNRPQREDRPYKKRFQNNQQDDNGAEGNQTQNADNQNFKGKFIRKGRDGKNRNNQGGKRRDDRNKVENRDLDKELINYWTKTKKGEKGEGENKQQAIKVLNLEMDSYWRKKQAQQKGKAATS